MAYDSILKALTGDAEEDLATNPWYVGGTKASAMDPTNPYEPAWKNILAKSLLNFSGGLGQGFGKSQAENQATERQSAVLSALSSTDPNAAFTKLSLDKPEYNKYATLYGIEDANNKAELRRKQNELRMATRFNKFVDVNPKDGTVTELPGAADSLASIEGTQEAAKAKARALVDEQYVPKLAGLKAQAEAPYKQEYGQLYPSLQPVSDEQIQIAAESLSLDPAELRQSVKTAQDLDRIVRMKGAAGERVRPPSSSEAERVANSRIFQQTMTELKDLADQMAKNNKGSVSRMLSAGRIPVIGGITEDPASAEYKYYALLDSAQQQYARGRDSGALAQSDIKLYGPLFQGSLLNDKPEVIKKRLEDIERRAIDARKEYLNSLKSGGANVDTYMREEGMNNNSSDEAKKAAFKQAYKAKRRAEMMQQGGK